MAEVKQEGEFKVKSRKMKKLAKEDKGPIKVDLTAKKEEEVQIEEPIKVDLTKKKEEDAVQTQETNDSDAVVEEPKDSSDSEAVVEEIRPSEEKLEEEVRLIQEITEEEVQEQVEELTEQVEQAIVESDAGIELPENIQKVVDFMNETGGTLQDYVRLNADYSNISESALLEEYYAKTKPYLEREDISLLLEDFSYDEELDDERDVRKKKIAYKEEIAKAKNYLEGLKSKYYDEIKLRPGVTQEQQKALDFFNRYNEEQTLIKQRTENFQSRTKNYFDNDFKGFDFNLGEKKFRYGLKDNSSVANTQSDINNFVKKFLNDKGELSDLGGYHKALYVANNPDRVINHFYEQGKADAIREMTAKSKNISSDVRQTQSPDVFVNGLKVKVLSGNDSSKLKIKKIKLNS
jgi:hypothetical protein